MSCAADLSTMTDADAHEACEELRKLLCIRRIATFPTPTADANPCAEAVVGGELTEQGEGA
jgi:hypothetical protein